MIVVSDTTPLNYLVLINAIDVLAQLFGEVLVPPSVIQEMTRLKTPLVVRQWATSPPAWLKIIPPTSQLASTKLLGDGEADAISLAKERHIAQILIDERVGRRVAKQEGLHPLPTLAILELAASKKLLDLRVATSALLQTTFRIPPDEIAAALSRDAIRKQMETTDGNPTT